MMKNVNPDVVIFDRELVAARDYWIERLSEPKGPSNLRLDFPRPKSISAQEGLVKLELTGETYQRFVKLTGGSPFLRYVMLMAVIKVCIYKYTGSNRIVIGSPSLDHGNGSDQPGNALAIVDVVEDSLTFREFLLKVRQTLLDAYARQHYPFDRLVEDLGLEKGNNHCPLFDVALVLEEIHTPMPGVNNDITLIFNSEPHQLTGRIVFKQDLFKPETIERLGQHFVNELQAALDNSAALIGDLSLLGETEQHQLLVEWNDTASHYLRDACIHYLFEEQAERTPDAIAGVFDTEALTYDALNRRANQLAHYLHRVGVGPEVVVGLCMERSLGMLAGMLAILKASGAYMPLDPGYPSERLSFMLDDAQVMVVVSQQDLLDRLPAEITEVICMDSDWERLSGESQRDLSRQATSANLAYVIYTSGSTGQPKGVGVEHRSLVNLVSWHRRVYQVGEEDRASQLAGLGFDASVWEVWPYLCAGSSLYVPKQEERSSPERVMKWLAERGVTISFLPTPWAEAIIGDKCPTGLALRVMLTGGDKLRRRFDGTEIYQLLNNYGPTEGTVVTTWCEVGKGEADPPIGRAVDNTGVYVLGSGMRPQPIGVGGELHIGGESLARGYIRRGDLTADRFIPDGISGSTGRRLYRTGDVVRYRRDGMIEFVGRLDHQVKVRGFRIELGEIEAVFVRHSAIRDVVVQAREDESGNQQLVAYLVIDGEKAPGYDDWRRYLKEKLPEYMIPTAFVILDSLPLTSNGKVDRAALPAPDQRRPELEEAFAAPRTPVEQVLAEVWSDVLGVTEVGINDNFFDSGGDSIRSIQVAAKARERGIDFSIEQLFQFPTIGMLAQAIEPDQISTAEPQMVTPFGLISEADRERLPDGLEDAYPLTRLQAGMMFHNEYNPEAAVYHNIISFHLQGPVSIEAMGCTIQHLVERHAVLRTSFDLAGFSEPMQLVHRTVDLPLNVEDLRHLSAQEQEFLLATVLEEEKKKPFDWQRAPLVRFQLYLRSEDTFQLVMIFPHAILDGWSDATLLTELFHHYLFLQGEVDDDIKPAPKIAFRDYVALERKALASEASRSFWRDKLRRSTATRVPRWPSTRQPASGTQGNDHLVVLSPELVTGLNRLATNLGVSLKSVVLAAHMRMISWLSGQRDVVTGLVLHGRPDESDGERVIGLFLNATPFRLRLPEGSWEDLVRATYFAEQGVFPHRRFPMAEIQQMSGGESLFEVAFDFLHFHVYRGLSRFESKVRFIDIKAVAVTNFTMVANFRTHPLSSESGLSLMYDQSKLSPEQITTTMGYYLRTMEAMVSDPSSPYEFHSPLSEAENHQLLLEWNNTHAEYAQDLCVHGLIEQQAERTPDAIAVTCQQQQLSYRGLNERSNQLAHYLQRLGVGPEVRVGICVERSTEMLVGLLGILKSGGAYVPLDPTYPIERLSFMLEDARAPVLLTDQRILEEFPATWARAVCLDAEWDLIAQCSGLNPIARTVADNLAYVIYTSGSTGQPKGVQVSHRALLNLVWWHLDAYEVTERDRATQLAGVAFDASAWEVWPYLTCGASVNIVDEEARGWPERLRDWLQREEITISFLPTPLAERVIVLDWPEHMALREMLTGGDKLHHSPGLGTFYELVNNYGPTENAVVATYGVVAAQAEQETVPSIGRPISNAQVFLLDNLRKPVGIRGVGEVHIGGASLSRGYLNRPDLTAEMFIPNPFSRDPGDRLYRTGDLARYRLHGEIEYVGRTDYQVKINGFRIELGEVEAVLGQHPGVCEAAVIAREDVLGDLRLIAYIVPEVGNPPDAGELRKSLRELLPDYMVPATFVTLAAMPLTANGKVDRQALPAPDQTTVTPGAEFASPRTPLEELLTGIWAQVLGVERIGIRDNFFDLGGHSLLATLVMSRLREMLQVELPLRRLFEAPTVEGLAALVDETRLLEKGLKIPPIQAVSRKSKLPLSFAQERLWLISQLEPDNPFYNIPISLRISAESSIEALGQCFSEICRRHEALRTTFSSADGQPLQIIGPARPLRLSLIDLSTLPAIDREATLRRLVAEQARRPFNLAKGPLLRTGVVEMGDQQRALLLNMPHIVSDGWSIRIFTRELTELYTAFNEGSPSPLADLPIQYADFASWQREWLRDEFLASQLNYWKRHLDGASGMIDLPTDRPRLQVQNFNGASRSFELSETSAAALLRLSRQERVTLFMTLLAGFEALLHRYSGQEDICVGTPVANRNRAEIEGLIGFFVNTLVLRVDLSSNPSFVELLRRVRDVALEAYANQDLPFQYLAETIRTDRNLGPAQLCHVMFGMQHLPTQSSGLNAFGIESLKNETTTAKFDLWLGIVEDGERIKGTLEYDTDLFDDYRIRQMLEHFQKLLVSVVADPEQRVCDLMLLTEAEQEQLLVEWNNTYTAYPRHLSIHQVFEEQVAQTPEKVAVVFEGEQVTYQELNRRANQLAHYLYQRVVCEESLVGLCLDRSIELLVGMLGILKAGGAYLPLDPTHPKEQLAFMFKDSGLVSLVTQERYKQHFCGDGAQMVCLDSDWTDIRIENQANPGSTIKADNLAYVMYTSGSTGQPKGVEVCHSGVVRLVVGVDYAELNEMQTILQSAAQAFDASTFEIWAALLRGGRLVLFPELIPTADDLRRVICEEGVSTMWLTASLFNAVIDDQPKALSGLTQILIGGEALSAGHVGRAQEHLAGTTIINGYGPTESTTFTCCYSIDEPVRSNHEAIPIGAPISNTRVYLLDGRLQLVPVGVVGQLYIAGEGLARGYLGMAEMTAEKFVPDPFGKHPGSRLYKSGDLARFRRDGQIEFLGRIDHQVKVRGHRIELAEVEAALRQHAQVSEAAAVVRDDEGGEKRLVAYVVCEERGAVSGAELRRYLGERVPGYMVPAVIVEIEALPLSPNGKIDRKALPAPDRTDLDLQNTYVAPRTEPEQILTDMWSKILCLEKIGIHDNFFDLGGNSLLATKVVNQVSEVFQVRLPLRRLFESPTVAGLTRVIAELLIEEMDSEGQARLLEEISKYPSDDEEYRLAIVPEFHHSRIS